MLAEAGVLFVVGLWLLLRLDPELVGSLAARWLDRRRGGISAVQALLLIPVVALSLASCSGLTPGFGLRQVAEVDVASLTWRGRGHLVLIFQSRLWAATLADCSPRYYGWLIATTWVCGFADSPTTRRPPALDRRPGRLPPAGPGLWLLLVSCAVSRARPGQAGN